MMMRGDERKPGITPDTSYDEKMADSGVNDDGRSSSFNSSYDENNKLKKHHDVDCYENIDGQHHDLEEKNTSTDHLSDTEGRSVYSDDDSESFDLAKRESRLVGWSKILFLVTMIIVAAICGYLTYKTLEGNEMEQFHSEFSTASMGIAIDTENSAKTLFGSLESFSQSITSYALQSNSTFPFVTVPNYELRANSLLNFIPASSIMFCPIITTTQPMMKDRWEQWSGTTAANDLLDGGYHLPVWQTTTSTTGDEDDSHLPLLTSEEREQLNGLLPLLFEQRASIVGGIVFSDHNDEDHDDETSTTRPKSLLVTPIFDSLVDVKQDHQDESSSSNIVAILISYFAWEDLFVLNDGIGLDYAEMTIEIENNHGQAITYELLDGGGGGIEYVGRGNLHVPQFDHSMEVRSTFTILGDGIFEGITMDGNNHDDEGHDDEQGVDHQSSHGDSMSNSGMHDNHNDVMDNHNNMDSSSMNNDGAEDSTMDDMGSNGGGSRRKQLLRRQLEMLHHDEMMTMAPTHQQHQQDQADETTDGMGMVDMDMDNNMDEDDKEKPPREEYIYTIRMYPTEEFYESFHGDRPMMYTIAVVCFFVFTMLSFLLYDFLVVKRNNLVMNTAQQSGAIVDSLFPKQYQERLMMSNQMGRKLNAANKKNQKDSKLAADCKASDLLCTKPIADLFPECTVLFADISGFTPWASIREPSQVFTLLEQIYSAFDSIAQRRKIFKVETSGDVYVAAAGLPVPCPDHALVMARFANACRIEMLKVVKNLDVILGPGTAELAMKFGLSSGTVVAGVLRGEKSRFQLFGDTVNKAARIEQLGLPNSIHLSKETADLIVAGGKQDWVEPRDEMVTGKGVGTIQTYWLKIKGGGGDGRRRTTQNVGVDIESISGRDIEDEQAMLAGSSSAAAKEESTSLLIDWNVDVLQRLLKKVIAMREEKKKAMRNSKNLSAGSGIHSVGSMHDDGQIKATGRMIVEEVKEVIPLSTESKKYKIDPESFQLNDKVLSQLRDYVSSIALMYRDNPFHNFDHASHVVQSVTKLLSRIALAGESAVDFEELEYKEKDTNKLHYSTFGITSDPLIMFASAFSALIHDVDHTGLPNVQLVKEKQRLAEVYKNKSVAEQNSVELSWELLMEPSFSDLRACIYSNQEELNRFRQLVVNSVMATDIADKEQGAMRKQRWNKAFQLNGFEDYRDKTKRIEINRKATIVIEHLIQASDVSHTMQHWHVYIKWNEKLFFEIYKAWLDGRADADPSEGWYKGEIGFFDFYIIPLAKKLKNCGVFGVASDEYLNYATANRNEWEAKGKDIVAGFIAKCNQYRKVNNEEGSTSSNYDC